MTSWRHRHAKSRYTKHEIEVYNRGKNQKIRFRDVGAIGDLKSSREIELYRASDEENIGPETCWAESPADAWEYKNVHRHGSRFGGPVIYKATLHYDPNELLDLTNDVDRRGFDEIAASYFKWWGKEHFMDCGFRGLYALWEEDQGFSDLLVSKGVKFIKYNDDFPDGCVTWSFMGNAPRFPETVHTENQKRPVPTQWAMLE